MTSLQKQFLSAFPIYADTNYKYDPHITIGKFKTKTLVDEQIKNLEANFNLSLKLEFKQISILSSSFTTNFLVKHNIPENSTKSSTNDDHNSNGLFGDYDSNKLFQSDENYNSEEELKINSENLVTKKIRDQKNVDLTEKSPSKKTFISKNIEDGKNSSHILKPIKLNFPELKPLITDRPIMAKPLIASSKNPLENPFTEILKKNKNLTSQSKPLNSSSLTSQKFDSDKNLINPFKEILNKQKSLNNDKSTLKLNIRDYDLSKYQNYLKKEPKIQAKIQVKTEFERVEDFPGNSEFNNTFPGNSEFDSNPQNEYQNKTQIPKDSMIISLHPEQKQVYDKVLTWLNQLDSSLRPKNRKKLLNSIQKMCVVNQSILKVDEVINYLVDHNLISFNRNRVVYLNKSEKPDYNKKIHSSSEKDRIEQLCTRWVCDPSNSPSTKSTLTNSLSQLILTNKKISPEEIISVLEKNNNIKFLLNEEISYAFGQA